MKLRHNAQESVDAPGYRSCERGLVFPLVEGKAAVTMLCQPVTSTQQLPIFIPADAFARPDRHH
jgi:hypothetical protein